MDILNVSNLTFNYNDELPILKNLSFNVKNNELISIVGGSGCGKSTIIKLLANIETPTNGDISINSISYMPQSDTLLPWRTILQNILLPIEIEKGDLIKEKENALNLLKRFNLLSYADNYPDELSGGMKQRISLIRTLMNKGELLLLDEPFSALDAITREDLQKWLLNSLTTLQKSMIFITHDIDEAMFLSNRILVCKEKPISSFDEFTVPKNMTFEEKAKLKKEILTSVKGVDNEKI
ncbi:MAG: ATP-binding cassette domain-containing protein [Cetobacterium sp.]|uniref:ATP-binding cassette domain-containing protein n=1 Tax=unclassified Cetobacterium TaxID=2630983 RepID=UPI00068E92DE|nr:MULTISPECIES: ATP-binding cassette domain-containing protein [unclassified Cetobacterium]